MQNQMPVRLGACPSLEFGWISLEIHDFAQMVQELQSPGTQEASTPRADDAPFEPEVQDDTFFHP